jgi:hypothetical protein
MKMVWFSVLGLILLSSSSLAVLVDTNVKFLVENETYVVQQPMKFHTITIDASYIIFNDTGFYITSPNDIDVTLIYMNTSIDDDRNKILEFKAGVTSGNVSFVISGLERNINYAVEKNDVRISMFKSNDTGHITFYNDLWSNHNFKIFSPFDWDVNTDGTCSVLDFVFISNHYNEVGSGGWIREDVDNNGIIQVLDFVVVSNNYGRSW